MAFFAVLLVLPTGEAIHAADVWTISGPEAADVRALAIDPKTPTTIYVGTAGGGIFKTMDGGRQWHGASRGLVNGYVSVLVIDPRHPRILYAGTDNQGVFKSTDGTASWHAINHGLDRFGAIWAISIDPRASNTLYALAQELETGMAHSALFKTTDGGRTWYVLDMQIEYGGRALAIDAKSGAVYAGTGSGVHKSTTGGASWSFLRFKKSDTRGPWVTALAIDPVRPSTVYAGTDFGLFRSRDGGESWEIVNGFWTVRALALDPHAPQTVHVATEDGLLRTRDGGKHWIRLDSAFGLQALAYARSSPSTLYGGTSGDGVIKSTTDGKTWQLASHGLASSHIQSVAVDPAAPKTIYAGVYRRSIFKSVDQGSSWENMSPRWLDGAAVNVLAVAHTKPATIYAGTGDIWSARPWRGGWAMSSDEGHTWRWPTANFDERSVVQTIAIDPITPTTAYVGTNGIVVQGITSGGTVFRTTDGGATWTGVRLDLPLQSAGIYGLEIDPAKPTTVYAATGKGIFKSTDGAISWQLLALADKWFWALAIDPATTATLYAATGFDILKSTDAGQTWTVVSDGMPKAVARALLVDPSSTNTVYAGSDDGLFVSTNGGAVWRRVQAGPMNTAVNALAIDPTDRNTIYAATDAGVSRVHLGDQPRSRSQTAAESPSR